MAGNNLEREKASSLKVRYCVPQLHYPICTWYDNQGSPTIRGTSNERHVEQTDRRRENKLN